MAKEFQPGQEIQGYLIEEEIGRGGMGIVYRAVQKSLQRTVALKKIPEYLAEHPDILTRFQREALATARLNHSGIVQIYDYYENDGQPFYVMEYLEPTRWSSLREVLNREAVLDADRALEITQKILQPLRVAHEAGLIHRDIKPGNIMMNRDGDVKVLDFGIAILAGQTRLTMEASGQSGTADYMSPEQGEGREVDRRCDLYAVGTMLYEMLTGHLPFKADNPVVLLRMRSEKDPTPVRHLNPDVPEAVESMVSRAMERNLDRRYASAQQMIKDIERYRLKQPLMAEAVVRNEAADDIQSEKSDRFILEINFEETRVRVGFNPHGDDIRTVSQYDHVPADRLEIRRLSAQCTDLIQKANKSPGQRGSYLAELKKAGTALYDQLLPLAAKDALSKSRASYLILRLDDEAVRIPWELLYDGNQLLCRKFRCGRIVTTFQKVYSSVPREISDKARFLILSNPRGDLKAASVEGEQLKERLWHGGGAQIRVLNNRVSVKQLKEELREADLVHYSGHAHFDKSDPAQCGWQLRDGIFGAWHIRQLQGGQQSFPLVVFANACRSAEPEQGEEMDAESRVFSVANAYLLAGVQNYIGTIAEVLDAHAAEFACRFYQKALEGKPLGDAMFDARKSIVEQYGEDCLIWASYLMYGDPTRTLFQAAEEEEDEVEVSPLKEAGALEPAGSVRSSSVAMPRQRQRVPAASGQSWNKWIGLALAAVVVAAGIYFYRVSGSGQGPQVDMMGQAYAALQAGDYARAGELFSQVESRGDVTEAQTGQASLALAQGRIEEALRLTEQVIGMDVSASYAQVIQGMALKQQGNLERAEQSLRAGLAGNLDYAWQRGEALGTLGMVLASLDRNEEAAESLEKAVEMEPENTGTVQALAQVYEKTGREAEAQQLYASILKNNPDDQWAQFRIYDMNRRRQMEQDQLNHEKVMALLDDLSKETGAKVQGPDDAWTSRLLGVAILPPEVSGRGPKRPGEEEFMAYSLMEELAGQDRFRLVDRALLDKVLLELELTQEGLTDPANAVRVGEMLSARLVVLGTLFYFPSQVKAKYRIIDTETSEIIGFPDASSEEGVEALAAPLAGQLVEQVRRNLPLKGKVKDLPSGGGLELNIGRDHGVKEGMAFEVLSADGQKVGEVQIVGVQENTSRAVVQNGADEVPVEARVREMLES